MPLTLSEIVTNNYRYTGQQWDPDLGMYYLRARYYSPQLGRFSTADDGEQGSHEDPKSLHLYVFCEADPVNNTDPTGHEIEGMLAVMDISTVFFAQAAPAVSKSAATVVNQRAVFIHVDISPSGMPPTFNPTGVQRTLESQLSAALLIGCVPGQSLHVQVHVGLGGINGQYGWFMNARNIYWHKLLWDPSQGVIGYTLSGDTTTVCGTTALSQDWSAHYDKPPGDQFWSNFLAHEVIWHGCCGKGDDSTQPTGEIASENYHGFAFTPLSITSSHRQSMSKALGFK